jgi:ankyrin repeat protein
MQIIRFLRKMIAANIAALDSDARIYDREDKSWQDYKKNMEIRELIWRYELTWEELSYLIFLTVRLNSNVSLGGILKSGTNCNCCDENGDTPLIWAVRNGNKEIAKLLLDYGADPFFKNKQGLDAICYSTNKPEMLTLFEERYPMPGYRCRA